MTDHDLLLSYARDASEDAFAAIVRRHGDMVYSVGRRALRDDHLAEDIAQATFMVLARKAASLPRGTLLSCWLYTTACHIALNQRRSTQRRTRGEARFDASRPAETASDQAAWDEIRGHVDAALQELSQPQRDAIVLRCLKQMSPAEAAAEMGISEKAVSMRLSRGLEELRARLQRRGVATTSALLLGLISMNSAEAAPAAVATSTVAAVAGKVPATKVVTLLTQEALKFMFWTQVKTAAVACSVVLLLAGGTVGVARMATAEEKVEAAPAPPKPPAPEPAPIVAEKPDEAAKPAEKVDAAGALKIVKEVLTDLLGKEDKAWAQAKPYDKRLPEDWRGYAYMGLPGKLPTVNLVPTGFWVTLISVDLKDAAQSIWWEYQVGADGMVTQRIKKRLTEFPAKPAPALTGNSIAELDALTRDVADLRRKGADPAAMDALAQKIQDAHDVPLDNAGLDALKREVEKTRRDLNAAKNADRTMPEIKALREDIKNLEQKLPGVKKDEKPKAPEEGEDEIEILKKDIEELRKRLNEKPKAGDKKPGEAPPGDF